MNKSKYNFLIKIAVVILTGLTLLSFTKAILISLDIDESYATALGYRLASGDKLIRDMWEPHQFSAFLAAFFTAPYTWIRGNTDYLVIYLRMAGILIHSLFGFALYKQLSKGATKFFAFFITILHLNFLPKWVQQPEFELMHYWCLLGIFLVLYAYFTGKKHSLLLLVSGGCFLSGSVLCYPTMILLYPFYIVAIILLERQYFQSRKQDILKSCFFFTLGAALIGMILLSNPFTYMSLDELLRYLSYIFMDTSHATYTVGEKWALYLEQLQEQLIFYRYYLLWATGLVLVACLIYWFISYKSGKNDGKKPFSLSDTISVLVTVLLVTGLLMQIKGIYGFLLEDKNQFFFQIRYMAILLPAFLLGIRYHGKMAVWLHLCIIPGLATVPAVLFVTNMDTNTTYAKAFLGVLGSFLIFYQYSHEIMENTFPKTLFSFLQYTAGGMVLAGFLVCRLLLIRVTGCLPVTVLAPLEKMAYGPEKGIYILADAARIWNDNYQELDTYVDKEDKVLYIGSENLIYAATEALPATPSTQGTVVYNEMFLYYYEEHPERLPNVIVFDKSFAENPVYSQSYTFSLQNPVFFEWLEENYGDGQKIETDHMIILRKE